MEEFIIMEATVKYWPKDKSYSVYYLGRDKKRVFLYDGRSKEYKEWLSGKSKGGPPLVAVLWSRNTVDWTEVKREDSRRIVVLSIFEYPKEMGA